MSREQLTALAKPFPKAFVHGNPSGRGTYVKHHVVVQKMLMVLGPFDFELVEIVRGDVTGKEPNPQAESARGREGTPDLHGAVVGAVCRLTCEIDGKRTVVEEIGEVEDPWNWLHDGARMKDAMSDAIKRCAARIGVGLHLWSGEEFKLHDWLLAQAEDERARAPRCGAVLKFPDADDAVCTLPVHDDGPHSWQVPA